MKDQTNMFDLKECTALVVGATGNIGNAICRGLAAQGADIVVADLHSMKCISTAKRLTSVFPGRYVPAPADCSTEQGVESVIGMCQSIGPLNIIIHCIGLISSVSISGYAVPFEKQSIDAWNLALQANLTSAFILAKHLPGSFDEKRGASVIFLSSIYGSLGPDWSLYDDTNMGNPLAYGASKGGLQQLMHYLATLWAPVVRVNCISPGGIERGQPAEFIKRYVQRTPMKRMATVEDIVGPVVFLASDASRYITGQNLIVDGGWSAW